MYTYLANKKNIIIIIIIIMKWLENVIHQLANSGSICICPSTRIVISKGFRVKKIISWNFSQVVSSLYVLPTCNLICIMLHLHFLSFSTFLLTILFYKQTVTYIVVGFFFMGCRCSQQWWNWLPILNCPGEFEDEQAPGTTAGNVVGVKCHWVQNQESRVTYV